MGEVLGRAGNVDKHRKSSGCLVPQTLTILKFVLAQQQFKKRNIKVLIINAGFLFGDLESFV
jgi:hypothetical protein